MAMDKQARVFLGYVAFVMALRPSGQSPQVFRLLLIRNI